MTLEESLEYLNDDEYCEVTPESIRLRKKILDKNERERTAKKKKICRIKLILTGEVFVNECRIGLPCFRSSLLSNRKSKNGNVAALFIYCHFIHYCI